jgi:hypothetical protein
VGTSAGIASKLNVRKSPYATPIHKSAAFLRAAARSVTSQNTTSGLLMHPRRDLASGASDYPWRATALLDFGGRDGDRR